MSLFHTIRRSISSDLRTYLDSVIQKNRILLFMKGTAEHPQCQFSRSAVQILEQSGVPGFATINVLADEEIRQAMKEYSKWPTFPQLYVRGEFVGGNDVIKQMSESGELDKLLSADLQVKDDEIGIRK